MNSKLVSALAFLVLFTPGLHPAQNRRCDLTIVNADNKTVTIHAELAETDGARMAGLMFRRALPENSGMLFVFTETGYLNFWMKNTYLPLSIAYINRKGIINEIYHMKPLDISITYPSRLPAKYALEVEQGWFSRNKIEAGHKLNFHGCIGK